MEAGNELKEKESESELQVLFIESLLHGVGSTRGLLMLNVPANTESMVLQINQLMPANAKFQHSHVSATQASPLLCSQQKVCFSLLYSTCLLHL
jgi:hypothetical protein